MKRLLLVAAAAAALTACSQSTKTSDEAAAPESNEVTANADTSTQTAMVTANGTTPGTFDVTAKDGTRSQTTLNADGTYTDVDSSGKEVAHGTWNVADGKTCFDPEGDEGPTCWSETAPAADGSFTATSDKGDVVTVKKTG